MPHPPSVQNADPLINLQVCAPTAPPLNAAPAPQKERNYWEFYAIRKGLKGSRLYTNWSAAKLDVVNPANNNIYPFAEFKGFKT
eukprot:10981499-Ditylum_brightwellii.AAC.2